MGLCFETGGQLLSRPGDQRFLMIRNLNSEASREAVYVEHWFTELKAKLEQ